MAVSGWWNTSYSIRRPLTFENVSNATIDAGSSFFVVLDVASLVALNKLRPDYEDLEVALYDDTIATPGWVYVERDVTDNGDGTVSVSFQAESNISDTDNYYLYYCNRSLRDMPVRIGTESQYATATKDNGAIMLTRPTEDWRDGVSVVVNARAAFPFYGNTATLKFATSSSGGIVEILTDSTAIPVLIDTYGHGSIYEYVVEYNNLDRHIIRMRVTGNKNPASSDWTVALPEILYPIFAKVTVGSEEIYSGLISLRTTVGS